MNLRSAWLIVVASVILCAGSLSYPGGQVKDVTIDRDDQTTTIECKATAVSISGDDNKVTVTGDCFRLTVSGDDNEVNAMTVTTLAVSGSDNTVSVDTVASVAASGSDNKITWKKGVGGKRPEVSDKGEDNEIKEGGN
ncbi:MAG TPA: DUF3060 domain-containing protein [Terriglobia bacterium]|nr:DUF3060 domain-containing protein [Terriglobia bacterium]